MVDQFTLPTLIRAISNVEIEVGLTLLNKKFVTLVQKLMEGFLQSMVTAAAAHRFEVELEETVREFARSCVEWCFGTLETEDIEDLPGVIKHRGNSYHRISAVDQGERRKKTG
jgi:hypothetical protein